MARDMELHGMVIEGDYAGKNVYRWNDTSFTIVDGKISRGLFAPGFTHLQWISKETVESFEIVSSRSEAYIRTIGAVRLFSMLSGTASHGSAEHDLRFFFKNGKTCLIRFYFDACLQDLKRILS